MGAADTYQRYFILGTDSGNSDPDSQTWGTENVNRCTAIFCCLTASAAAKPGSLRSRKLHSRGSSELPSTYTRRGTSPGRRLT